MAMATPAQKSPAITNNVSRNYDPTHTTWIRNEFSREMRKRFYELRGVIRKAIIDRDCFGMLKSFPFKAFQMAPPDCRAFAFPRSADKIDAFMAWVKEQTERGILKNATKGQLGTAIEKAWAGRYVETAYQTGIARARQEMRHAGYDVPPIDDTGGIAVAFNQPFHMDRVGVLYTRLFNDLKGITDTMDMQLSRVLAQAMAEGKNPREIARLLVKTISGPAGDLGITDTLGRFIPAQRRAQLLARTEIIRAHHQATIQEYKNWGLEGVRVKAEWTTADDGRVCDECASMEGNVYTIEEIQNMIPAHPQCRCVAIPVDVTDL